MTRIDVIKLTMVKERTMPYDGNRKMGSSTDAERLLRQYFGDADREMFVALLLSTKHYVNGIHTVSIGSLDGTIVHPREVFKAAIIANAQTIIVGHNHPSGDVTPSQEDCNVTNRLVASGKLLGIEVLDHLIIGDGRFSFREHGMLLDA